MAGAHRRRRPDRARSSPARSVPVLDGTAERAPRRRAARARTCSSTRTGDDLDLVLIGTGSEVSLCVGGARAARRRRASRCGSCRCRRGTSSTAQPDDVPRRGAARPACPTLAVEAGVHASAGSATPTTSSASTASARRRPGDRGHARARLHRRARRRARAARCSSRTEELTMTQRDRPARTTSARAPGTTTSPGRCCTGGGLAQLVDDDGIRGVTSNPTIFEKAIGAGERLRRAARELRRRGLSIEDTYWALVLDDIVARGRRAAPGLRRARRRRRLRVGRGVARPRARHRRHDRAGAGAVRPRSTART